MRAVVYEAARHAGGRCRSYFDAATGLVIDNGNHFVAAGNHAVMTYLDRIGARDRLAGETTARFDFVDLADGGRWTLRPNAGRVAVVGAEPTRAGCREPARATISN